jgi:hypothetical protein
VLVKEYHAKQMKIVMMRNVVVILLVHRYVVLILIAIAVALVNRIAMNALAQMWVTVVILTLRETTIVVGVTGPRSLNVLRAAHRMTVVHGLLTLAVLATIFHAEHVVMAMVAIEELRPTAASSLELMWVMIRFVRMAHVTKVHVVWVLIRSATKNLDFNVIIILKLVMVFMKARGVTNNAIWVHVAVMTTPSRTVQILILWMSVKM